MNWPLASGARPGLVLKTHTHKRHTKVKIMSQGLDNPDFAPEKKRMPLWLKLGLGCGTICILSCLGVCGGGYWYVNSTIQEYTKKYEDQGYVKVEGTQLVVSDPVTEPTIFAAQQLSITTTVDSDIAILAQICEITGTINGDIDVMGQMIHIKKDAVVNGDIRVEWAQIVQIEGIVTGEVTGTHQVLDDRRQNANAGDDADDAAGLENVDMENVLDALNAPAEVDMDAEPVEAN